MVRRGRLASPTRFNPRTRVGCDEWSQTSQCRNHWFQSTHPRGVRLPVMRRRFQPHHVSIHAPAWGTTLRQTSGQRLDSCFNPRTRVGCDCGCWCGPTASSRFNPRTRVGCDTATTTKAAPDLDVSIHAPAWGATLSPSLNVTEQFQFQSTHPRGVRLPAGGAQAGQEPVSIHAPAWGATGKLDISVDGTEQFQSTHPRGVRPIDTARKALSAGVSIHAPAWGATPHFVESEVTDRFQSTHPRGVRPALRLHRQGP